MKKGHVLFLCAFLLGVILLVPTGALAEPFINPPELNMPGWQSPFPYQRNILLNFDDPSDPFKADYEGIDDPNLKESDFVELSGSVTWNENLGAIGTGGPDGGVGAAIFRIDNHIRDWPFKHVYVEATVVNSAIIEFPDDPFSGEFYWGPPYTEPIPVREDWFWSDIPGRGDARLLNYYFYLRPNPPFEDIYLPFEVPAGEFVWIEDLHVATECVVPIPGAVWLLGSGLIALVGIRRRFKTS
jgi:hypothetical protein